MKRLLALATGVLALLFLAACGTGAPASGGASAAPYTQSEPEAASGSPAVYTGSTIRLEIVNYISRGEEVLEELYVAPHAESGGRENLIADEPFSSGSIDAEVFESESDSYDIQVADAAGEQTLFEEVWLEDGASVFFYRLEKTGEVYLKVVFPDETSYVLYSDGTMTDYYVPPDDSDWPVYQITNETSKHLTSICLMPELGQPFGKNLLPEEGLAPGETFEFKYGAANAHMQLFDTEEVEYQTFDVPMEAGTPLTIIRWRGGLGLFIAGADGEELWFSFRDSVTDYSLDAVRPAYFDISNETGDGTGFAAVYAAPSAGGDKSGDLLEALPLADDKWTEISVGAEGTYDFWIEDTAGTTWRFTGVLVLEFSTMTVYRNDSGSLALRVRHGDGIVESYSAS